MINLSNFSSIFIANWKLNANNDFINDYYQKLLPSSNSCVVICSPSIYLNKLKINSKNLFSGAQDVSFFNEGAYTGELSSRMLLDNNISFCIVGHSERRQYFNESNKTINQKATNLINNKIIPIICIGETLKQREQNITFEILLNQIKESIPEISNKNNCIIAYEPIWAIGTGITPTLDQIEEVHTFIKNSKIINGDLKILYGGSVKPSNSANINRLKSVDGCLVGGASLNVEEFNTIIS